MLAPSQPEKIVWSQPPDMPGIETLDVENCQRLWNVFHQTYTICSVTEHGGLTEWGYRGKRRTLYRKNVIIMEPGELHRNYKHTAIGSFHVVHIDPGSMRTLVGESGWGAAPHFKLAQTCTPAVFGALVQFHRTLIQGASLLERQSRLTDCIWRIMAECGERGPRVEPPPAPAALRLARDYLHEHYVDKVALADLSNIAGLSRFHFLRTFAERFGLPPHAYQIQSRLEKTRALLKAGVPINAIEAGFADQPHLTRHFKKATGVTPGQYVAMVRGCRR
jgi:AraC-like DNA-binding protein